ncbi:MAG: hypothetical protein Mars2KO_45250 [Maribacter sp.]
MKTTIKKLTFGMALIALTITSCTKEGPEGPIGPIGPQGAQGLEGEQGVQGDTGQDGEDGNANVIASPWIEPTSADMYVIDNLRNKVMVLDENMNFNTIHNGTILVYYDNDVTVHSLPYYNVSPSSGELSKSITSEINHASRTLYLKINKFTSDLQPSEYLWNPSGPAYAKGVRFRYVIIPENTSGKTSSINYAKMTYHEVMDYFQLEY